MKIYLIQYNIKEDSAISERIKSLGAWMHYFEGSWIVASELNAKEIYEKISVDYKNERFLIMELKKDNFWGVMPKDAWDWIQNR